MCQDGKTCTLKKRKKKKSGGHSHHLVNVPDAQQVAVLLQAVVFGIVPRLLLAGEEVTGSFVLSPALLTLGPGCAHKTPHAANQWCEWMSSLYFWKHKKPPALSQGFDHFPPLLKMWHVFEWDYLHSFLSLFTMFCLFLSFLPLCCCFVIS